MSQSENQAKNQTQDFFKRVHLSERKFLFQGLVQSKSPLLMKIAEDDLIPLTALRLDADFKLYIAGDFESLNLQEGQAVIVNFSVEEDRYFFLSQISFENKVPFLLVDVDLFQLQRRQNVRIDIPEDYPATLNIIAFEGKPCFIESRVVDVSAGGCRVFLESTSQNFKVDDKLQVVLHLGHRRPMNFRVDVRFVNTKAGSCTLGLQFLDRTGTIENKLLTMMTDFQRELYIKYTVNG